MNMVEMKINSEASFVQRSRVSESEAEKRKRQSGTGRERVRAEIGAGENLRMFRGSEFFREFRKTR